MERQIKLHTHQMDAMKEELSMKDAVISKVLIDKADVEKELTHIKVLHYDCDCHFSRCT